MRPRQRQCIAKRRATSGRCCFARIYEVLPLTCPQCGGAMKIIGFIIEAVVMREILGHLREPTSPPCPMPARGPPLWEIPGSDPAEGDPRAQPMPDSIPDYEFDQRIAWSGKRRQDWLVGGESCLWPSERQTSAAQVATGTHNGHAGARFQGLVRRLRRRIID